MLHDRVGDAAVDGVDEHRVRHRGRVVVGILRRIDLRVGHRLDHVGDRGRQRPERRDGMLARLGGAGVGHDGQDDQLAVPLGRHERQRRRRHHVGDHRQLLGSRLGQGDEFRDHPGAGRQQQHAANDRGDRVQPVLEAGGHPEVAATAADRPEQVRVVVGVGPQQLAVGGDEVGGQQVVDGQAVLADQVADAAAEGDPADADRAGVAEPGRKPIARRGAAVGGR